MSTKFEQLLDYLVNEEMDKANELFHEIVVEKSRDIYENLIAEEEQEADEAREEEADESVDEAEEDADESVDEAEEDADESVEEGHEDLEDSYELEADDDSAMGGDSGDEFGKSVGMGDMGDEMPGDGEEGSVEMDIQTAIDQLQAAFDKLDGGHVDVNVGGDMAGDDSMGGADDEDEDEGMMMGMREGRRMTREYTEKVGNDWEKNSQKTQGQYAGAGTGEKMSAPVDGKPPVSSGKGKPVTGADAGSILGKSATAAEDGTKPHGKAGGFLSAQKDMNTGNGNVPGGKMGVKNLSKVGSGYPGNNKTPGPVGSGTGDKAGQTSVGQVKSPINGAPNRNA